MSIATSVPSTLRKPGTFHEFDTTSAARGLVPIRRRVALIGCQTDFSPATVNVPVQIFDEAQADAAFGVGSELAIMCRAAIKAGAKYGASPEIWACPIADPDGDKATYTLTVTGPATASGNITLFISGRVIQVGVTSGDAQNAIATKIQKAIATVKKTLSVTPSVATNVVTLTRNNAGVNGNDVVVEVGPTLPAGVAVVAAADDPGTGDADITDALDALTDQTYHGVIVANHKSGDLTALATYQTLVGQPGTKRWSMSYMAVTGTLSTATTLATGANKKEQVVVTAEDFPSLPAEIATHVGVTIEGEARPNRSFDGVELDLPLPPKVSVPTDPELETALGAGATPLTVDEGAVQIVRAVTTKTTEDGSPFENLLDVGNIRTLFAAGWQVDARWKRDFKREDASADVDKRIWSSTYDVLLDMQALGWLQNVEAHKSQLVVAPHPSVPTRRQVSIPESVVPNLHQLSGLHVLYVE